MKSNNSNNNSQQTTTSSSNGLLTGDLESSLASLAENLTIHNRAASLKWVKLQCNLLVSDLICNYIFRGVQWNSPKSGSKTNWTPQPISDTTGADYKPMKQSMPPSPFSSMTITSPQPQIYPQQLLVSELCKQNSFLVI